MQLIINYRKILNIKYEHNVNITKCNITNIEKIGVTKYYVLNICKIKYTKFYLYYYAYKII